MHSNEKDSGGNESKSFPAQNSQTVLQNSAPPTTLHQQKHYQQRLQMLHHLPKSFHNREANINSVNLQQNDLPPFTVDKHPNFEHKHEDEDEESNDSTNDTQSDDDSDVDVDIMEDNSKL